MAIECLTKMMEAIADSLASHLHLDMPQNEKISGLFQENVNSIAINLYQTMNLKRHFELKNFVFFTPHLIASLSMLLEMNVPTHLKNIFKEILNLGEFSEEQWGVNVKEWLQEFRERSEKLPVTLLKTKRVGFEFQKMQTIASNNVEAEEVQNFVNQIHTEFALMMSHIALPKEAFKYNGNSIESFYNADGTEIKVEMINQRIDELRMIYDPSYEIDVLELPFHEGFSLWFIKPKNQFKKSKDDLENFMTPENIHQLLIYSDQRFCKIKRLSLELPKISFKEKMNFLNEINPQLNDILLQTPFSEPPVQAIISNSSSTIISQVTFKIDEEDKRIEITSHTHQDSYDSKFKLNSPFGLIWIDEKTKTIIGMGQILKITEANVRIER